MQKFKSLMMSIWPGHSTSLAREQITELLEESIRDTVTFDSHESMLLKNILGLRDIAATDVMVPRADIVSVDINDGVDVVMGLMVAANHSRVPVTRGSLDDVVGILHIKDVARCLHENNTVDLMSMLRQPIYISPTMRTMDLLQEMRLKRLHLALVVDEYGGTDGLIRIEDLVEEIVGEINDEHDDDTSPIFDVNGDGTALAEARLEIEQLEAHTGSLLEDEDRDEIDTLGGLVISLAGRVPGRGEIVRHPLGVEFEVLESNPRQVNLLKVRGLDRISVSADALPDKTPYQAPDKAPDKADA
ncbi:MAG: HlyC/CorC family transporter [Alphaproteobacteria bacterium]|nr:HlyC/CorC family transporter [Alphaproteobacteria bacterium]